MFSIQVSWFKLGREENRLDTLGKVCCGHRSGVKLVNLLSFDKHAIPPPQTETANGSAILTFSIFFQTKVNISLIFHFPHLRLRIHFHQSMLHL